MRAKYKDADQYAPSNYPIQFESTLSYVFRAHWEHNLRNTEINSIIKNEANEENNEHSVL